MELVSAYLAPGFLFKLMLCIARYFQATWRERAPFQKPVHSPSWRRRGRRWSYWMRWQGPNLVPVIHKTIQWPFTIIGWIKNKQITFQHRPEGGIQCAPNILWLIICWKSFIWPSTHAVMMSKDQALSSPSLLQQFVFIVIYHKYLQGMSFWCTWSSLKTLTHLIIAGQHLASCRTQAARCQTIAEHPTGHRLVELKLPDAKRS